MMPGYVYAKKGFNPMNSTTDRIASVWHKATAIEMVVLLYNKLDRTPRYKLLARRHIKRNIKLWRKEL